MSKTLKKLDHALQLAELGFRVFPLTPGRKTPPKDFPWKEEATRDTARIKEWWGADPAFNIGVAMGQGTIVVDADTKKGKPGLASLETLDLLGLPQSFRVKTPSGGLHVYLRVEKQHNNRVDSIPDYPGIDIRSDDGYVLGPGSIIDGKTYEALPGAIEPAGEWLEDILLKNAPSHTIAKTKDPVVELDLPEHVNLAVEYLTQRAPEAVEGAGGNETTYRVAAQCRDFGLSPETTFELMLEHWNEAKAFPAWLPADLQTVVGNAYKYATGEWGGRTAAADFEAVDIDIGVSPMVAKIAADAGATVRNKRWLFETVGDLRKMPPVKWLVKGWIPENASGIVYGKWGSGKSFIMFDLAFHLAHGFADWHGAALPGEPRRVLVLAREGHQGFTGRYDAFKRHHGLRDDNDRVVFMREPISFAKEAEFRDFVAAVNAQAERFDLILIDTVARVIPGIDMSSPESITLFTERCALLTKATGATTIGVHHQNKGGSIFGSVFFEANSDFVFKVEKTGGDEGPLQSGAIMCTKMKDGEDGWKKLIRYEKVTLGSSIDAGSSLVVAEISGTARTSKLGEALKVIKEAHEAGQGLSQHPRAKERYAAAHIAPVLRIDVKAAAALVADLLRKGFVSEFTDAKTKGKFLAPAFAAAEFDAEDTVGDGGDAAET